MAPFEKTMTVRRPRILPLVVLMSVLMLMLFFSKGSVGPLPLLMVAVTRLPWVVKPREKTLPVTASLDGLRLGGRQIPRGRLTSAFVRRDGERLSLVIRGRRWLTLDLRVSDEAEADGICRALALDPASKTTEFVLAVRRSNRGLVAGIATGVAVVACALGVLTAFLHVPAHSMSLLGVLGLASIPLALVIALLTFAVRSGFAKVIVGADGILVRASVGAPRFYPHDAIERVDAVGPAVVLTLRGGQTLQFYESGTSPKDAAASFAVTAASVVRSIEQSREVYRRLAPAALDARAALLARGGRPARAWLEQLRRAGEAAASSFRDAALTRDELLEIAENPRARAGDRLAAAAALRASAMSDEEKPRLRVAAERCALPALRERMVRVLDSADDEALAAALEHAELDVPDGPSEHSRAPRM